MTDKAGTGAQHTKGNGGCVIRVWHQSADAGGVILPTTRQKSIIAGEVSRRRRSIETFTNDTLDSAVQSLTVAVVLRSNVPAGSGCIASEMLNACEVDRELLRLRTLMIRSTTAIPKTDSLQDIVSRTAPSHVYACAAISSSSGQTAPTAGEMIPILHPWTNGLNPATEPSTSLLLMVIRVWNHTALAV